jgi:hypothetical protein
VFASAPSASSASRHGLHGRNGRVNLCRADASSVTGDVVGDNLRWRKAKLLITRDNHLSILGICNLQ